MSRNSAFLVIYSLVSLISSKNHTAVNFISSDSLDGATVDLYCVNNV